MNHVRLTLDLEGDFRNLIIIQLIKLGSDCYTLQHFGDTLIVSGTHGVGLWI
jgi:hypothetical protein